MMSSQPAERRRYRSPRRSAQAQATRRAVLDAARRLFVSQGYAATSREQVAAAAGVAVQTLATVAPAKRGLLQAVLEEAGRDERGAPLPVTMRSQLRDLRAAPDAAALLRAHARSSAALSRRTAGLAETLRRAAAADPELAAMWSDWQRQRRRGQAAVVDLLAQHTPPLRAGLGRDEAADVLWALTDDALHDSLVGERGWSAEGFAAWLGEAMCALLLERADA
jgi:AcrR family transcriptional regulator